ncbi:hypothetical protein Syun_009066 [Stephania yunnanensis]|uniref:Uncharacterized protein n=1 Tax=Stephania yunnanensis TaxID=152371 RepID=A0AAP0PNP9_9MAGN
MQLRPACYVSRFVYAHISKRAYDDYCESIFLVVNGGSDSEVEFEAETSGFQDVGGVQKADGLKLLPFEFKSLEVCLESACRRLENEVRDELENLLDDDMDMVEMYLTDKLARKLGENDSRNEDVDMENESDCESERYATMPCTI